MIRHDNNTSDTPLVACVTGASGMVGGCIVEKLLELGYRVRVLTRQLYPGNQVRVFAGSLSDDILLDEFIKGADMVFHCAAELNDESKMRAVNVDGTGRIVELVAKHHVRYFCHLSSAGVVGRSVQRRVDEATLCQPQNIYEQTKLEAEKLAGRQIEGCNTIILRPTNVVDRSHLGELHLAVSGSLKSRVMTIVKGGECAHMVHATDVAAAALFFLDRPPSQIPRLFFVSRDDDPQNTVGALWSLYRAMKADRDASVISPHPHLPVCVPFILRRMVRRTGNCGNVRYSSERLISEGFRFSFGIKDIVANIIAEQH
jgi:nucleoside-diphosphate-sugar epimerase